MEKSITDSSFPVFYFIESNKVGIEILRLDNDKNNPFIKSYVSSTLCLPESEVENIFSNDNKNQLFMNVEVTLQLKLKSERNYYSDWAAKS